LYTNGTPHLLRYYMKIQRARERPVSTGDRVYADLRMAILSGKIPPGSRLVESRLAREVGVSRTPVREALHKLNLENLVHSIPRVGYIVTEISEYDIEDLFAMRTAIEQLAGRWAVGKINADELERLEENLRNTDQVLENGMTKKMIGLDTEFHEIICKASRNKRLYQISQNLREHMLKFRMACLYVPQIAKRARDGHFGIWKAIKTGNAEKVEKAILLHMAETKKDILDYIRKLREDSL
jgi:DNA-binding GntR family transcriptional regulator